MKGPGEYSSGFCFSIFSYEIEQSYTYIFPIERLNIYLEFHEVFHQIINISHNEIEDFQEEYLKKRN